METIKKNLPLIIIVIVVIIAIAYFLMPKKEEDKSKNNSSSSTVTTTSSKTTSTTSTTSSNGAAGTTYTLAEVGTHDTPTSCWVSYKKEVYDVTSYISSHPGGEEIKKACGQDLEKYNSTHQGGAFDSSTVKSALTPLKIGALVN